VRNTSHEAPRYISLLPLMFKHHQLPVLDTSVYALPLTWANQVSHPYRITAGKVRPRTDHDGPGGEYRYNSSVSWASALDEGGWLTPRPGRFTTGKETQYPLYRWLGGHQGRSGRVQKITSLPGFDLRTVEPVAKSPYQSRYSGPYPYTIPCKIQRCFSNPVVMRSFSSKRDVTFQRNMAPIIRSQTRHNAAKVT
jgi:hypothetical protein